MGLAIPVLHPGDFSAACTGWSVPPGICGAPLPVSATSTFTQPLTHRHTYTHFKHSLAQNQIYGTSYTCSASRWLLCCLYWLICASRDLRSSSPCLSYKHIHTTTHTDPKYRHTYTHFKHSPAQNQIYRTSYTCSASRWLLCCLFWLICASRDRRSSSPCLSYKHIHTTTHTQTQDTDTHTPTLYIH